MELGYVVAGLLVGFVVGLTGVGGGSLMTPILLWFGISPATAVGTDLLYAAITKAGGVLVHHRQRHVDWGITIRLAAGSLPAALVTLLVLSNIDLPTATINAVIKLSLGVALILTALAILFKPLLIKFAHRVHPGLLDETRARTVPTVLIGVMLGVLVTLSSIGAGALGTLALFLLYPALPTTRLVGTEIAHAVPLTLVAGIGHASMGNLDYGLLVNLLIGSLPGIWMGSRLTRKMAESWMRPALAIMLAIVGTKLVY
ncbi:sulfite exporter TauE/SafE family protein [Pseudogulbenkiania sp. MAI-1]|uniref:sulfite exporter TauE/SafE family protein n=1 Tax=Pseudogulbenkiania sp. MAI-1 TaxID=990370 RepID=UPI00045E77D4|nr:sulfite exporter TauE/SafE family protein [Pseudogulbenkiania sp. MAI-1]